MGAYLQLQQVAITQPKFNQTELEAEKGNVRSELVGYLNNHNRVLWPKIQQLLGNDIYTYHQRVRTIAHVQLSDIQEHYRRTHTSDNLRFVIAGKMAGRKAQIKRMLESWQLPRGERFAVPHDELHSGKPTLIRRKEASNLTFGWSMEIRASLAIKKTLHSIASTIFSLALCTRASLARRASRAWPMGCLVMARWASMRAAGTLVARWSAIRQSGSLL